MEGSSNFVTIAPKPIPEMSELLNQVRFVAVVMRVQVRVFCVCARWYCMAGCRAVVTNTQTLN
jgi:hypothetical protein